MDILAKKNFFFGQNFHFMPSIPHITKNGKINTMVKYLANGV